jgi:cytoskeletal protein RodZ
MARELLALAAVAGAVGYLLWRESRTRKVYRVEPTAPTTPTPAPAPTPAPVPVQPSTKSQEVPEEVKKVLQTIVTNVTPEAYQQAKQVLETSIPEPYYSAIRQAEETLSSPYKEQAVVNATAKASVLPPPPEPAEPLVTGEGHVLWCFQGDCLFPYRSAEYDPTSGTLRVVYADGTVNYILSKDLGDKLMQMGVVEVNPNVYTEYKAEMQKAWT